MVRKHLRLRPTFFDADFCSGSVWELSWGAKSLLTASAESAGNPLNYSLFSIRIPNIHTHLRTDNFNLISQGEVRTVERIYFYSIIFSQTRNNKRETWGRRGSSPPPKWEHTLMFWCCEIFSCRTCVFGLHFWRCNLDKNYSRQRRWVYVMVIIYLVCSS